MIKEQVDILTESPTFRSKIEKGWLIFEAATIIILVMGSIMMLWLYTPFNFLAKFAITVLSSIIVYDVYKGFIYVRWALTKT